jgi:hypothetical protein
MKYAHPDVLDNGPAFIRNNATRVLLVPSFHYAMAYAEVLAAAVLSAAVSPADFTLSDAGTGRQLVFAGLTANASASMVSSTSQVVFTDGTSRILWVDDQTKVQAIAAGQPYKLPQLIYTVPQPVQR